jgi:hypothetical protein
VGLVSREVIPFAQTLELMVIKTEEMFSTLLKPHQIGCSNTKENQGMNPFYFQKHKNLMQEESLCCSYKKWS